MTATHNGVFLPDSVLSRLSDSALDAILLSLEPEVQWLSIEHAPPGGLWVGGTFYNGGRFIPDEAIDQASDEELDAILAHHEKEQQGGAQAPVSPPSEPHPTPEGQPDLSDFVWPGEEEKPAKAKPEEKHNDHGIPHKPEVGKVYNVAPAGLKIDPKRFQYKSGVDASGVTQVLKHVTHWNPDFAGVLSVWKDPEDGQTYVVNGHHRFELAQRLGVKDLAVRYVNAEGWKEARAAGALVNIAEGRGTAVDAAKFMRDMGVTPEKMKERGVSMSDMLAANAVTLSKLSDPLFDRVARGLLPADNALAVAKHLADHELQNILFRDVIDKAEERGKEFSPRVLEELARQMAATPKVSVEKDGGLFGSYEDVESLFVPRAELQAHVRSALAQKVKDFLSVANQKRAERVKGAGNEIAVAENKRIAEESDRVLNAFETLANSKGMVGEALTKGAADWRAAKTKTERQNVSKRITEAVRGAVFAETGVGESEADAGRDGSGVRGVSGGDAVPQAPAETPDAGGRSAGEPGLTPEAETPVPAPVEPKSSPAPAPVAKPPHESTIRDIESGAKIPAELYDGLSRGNDEKDMRVHVSKKPNGKYDVWLQSNDHAHLKSPYATDVDADLAEHAAWRAAGFNPRNSPAAMARVIENHKRSVRDALASGQVVPPEVLAEYPDLTPKPVEQGSDLLELHDRAMQALRDKKATLPTDPESLGSPRKRYENILKQAAGKDASPAPIPPTASPEQPLPEPEKKKQLSDQDKSWREMERTYAETIAAPEDASAKDLSIASGYLGILKDHERRRHADGKTTKEQFDAIFDSLSREEEHVGKLYKDRINGRSSGAEDQSRAEKIAEKAAIDNRSALSVAKEMGLTLDEFRDLRPEIEKHIEEFRKVSKTDTPSPERAAAMARAKQLQNAPAPQPPAVEEPASDSQPAKPLTENQVKILNNVAKRRDTLAGLPHVDDVMADLKALRDSGHFGTGKVATLSPLGKKALQAHKPSEEVQRKSAPSEPQQYPDPAAMSDEELDSLYREHMDAVNRGENRSEAGRDYLNSKLVPEYSRRHKLKRETAKKERVAARKEQAAADIREQQEWQQTGTMPDGRQMAKAGDKVSMTMGGAFGMPMHITGDVVEAKGGRLKVKISGSSDPLGLGHVSSKVVDWTPQWTVEGDPHVAKRRDEAKQEKETKQRQEAEEQKTRDEWSATHGIKADPANRSAPAPGHELKPGDILEDQNGRRVTVSSLHTDGSPHARDADGGYEYTLGNIDAWRKVPGASSMPPEEADAEEEP